MKNLIKKMIKRFGYELVRKRSSTLPQTDFNLLLSLLFYKISSDFFFVQVGANDGRRNDPLYHFTYKYKLSGLLIEPQVDVFEDLRRNYNGNKNLIFSNVAISNQNGSRAACRIKHSFRDTYNTFKSGDASGGTSFYKEKVIGSLKRNGKIFFKGKNPEDYIEETNIKTRTFESLIKEHNIKSIDLLQVDTEGYDFEVIKLFDFNKYSPIVVNYESKHLSRLDQMSCELFLREKDYLLFSHGGDTCAIHNKVLTKR